MIITFSDWPAATLIRMTGVIYSCFIYLCGQITIGLLLGETFPVWSNDLSSNESLNQSIWSASNHIKMFSPSQTLLE